VVSSIFEVGNLPLSQRTKEKRRDTRTQSTVKGTVPERLSIEGGNLTGPWMGGTRWNSRTDHTKLRNDDRIGSTEHRRRKIARKPSKDVEKRHARTKRLRTENLQ